MNYRLIATIAVPVGASEVDVKNAIRKVCAHGHDLVSSAAPIISDEEVVTHDVLNIWTEIR